jgi:serine/threonine protein kinase
MPPSDRELVADRFRPLFIIGHGGMGWVELALEQGQHGIERIVALKRMLPEASVDKHHVDMFMREAHVAELLSHPNVVHAYSFGQDNGELFLAMEYVEGEPLSRVLSAAHAQEGRIAAPLVAHFLAEVCEGLHAAHELRDANGTPLNLIHRDVSPHNVMVAYEGHVKLLDFGVVKIDQLDPKGGRTKTGEVKGKTAYMSPEQAMGEPLDRRSDLYSLGAVLFECICGQKMWGTGTDLDVLRRLALEEPPRLSDVAPSAPAALCALQQRLVARDREDRPPTALAVAVELRRFIAETGTQPNAQVVHAVMGRLFQKDIQRRHDTLAQLLHKAAPDASDELRKSLVTGFSQTRIEVANPVVDVKPVIVRARGMSSFPPRAERETQPDPEAYAGAESVPMNRPRVLPWAIALAALLVLGSAASLKWFPRSTAVTPAASTSTEPSPQPSPSARPGPSLAQSTPSSTPLLTTEPRPPRVGGSTTPPQATPPPPPRTPRPARSAAPTGPSPLPVDEHPI